MSRTFKATTTEFGTDVVDDHGTRYAAFDAHEPGAEMLGGRLLALARNAYEAGSREGDLSGEIGVHRSRSRDGSPSWEVRIGGASVGSAERSVFQASPPQGVRAMLMVARDVYAIARSDIEAAPAMAP